ncbi:hypothetical protein LA76x_2456 [Lysobacter antibioticus]|uniref:Uncharacterized protein n=1 Tax=Lysobacter antibioticus TaxID=84531 RepID=A0A0S2FAL9_LYSAN|nr:hypothetical protein LA76x_2456 [Lysobacter antibioticus]
MAPVSAPARRRRADKRSGARPDQEIKDRSRRFAKCARRREGEGGSFGQARRER